MKWLELALQVSGIVDLFQKGYINEDKAKSIIDDIVQSYYYDEKEFERFKKP